VSDVPVGELVKTIARDPDPLHPDVTPSVLALIDRGAPGARAVLPLLDDADRDVRRHAQSVLEGVVLVRHGWRPGRGYPDPFKGEAETEAVLRANAYDADAPTAQRREAAERWRRWLDEPS
jgi:hypothetical protein